VYEPLCAKIAQHIGNESRSNSEIRMMNEVAQAHKNDLKEKKT